jgi:hypothetical protein
MELRLSAAVASDFAARCSSFTAVLISNVWFIITLPPHVFMRFPLANRNRGNKKAPGD